MAINADGKPAYAGIGARVDAANDVQMIEALNSILATLESTKTTLVEAFDAFDSNGSGSISISEFSSLMRTLGGLGLTRRQIYHLGQCMDENFDRSVGFNEFMQFFLVLWTTRLYSLKVELREQVKTSDGIDHTTKRRIKELQTMITKTERALRVTFGAGFAEAAKKAKASLPGPFSTLMRGMQMGKHSVQDTFLDLEKVFTTMKPGSVPTNIARGTGRRQRKGEAARATEAAITSRRPEFVEKKLQNSVDSGAFSTASIAVPSTRTAFTPRGVSRQGKSRRGVIPGRNNLKRIRMAKEIQNRKGGTNVPARKVVHGEEVSYCDSITTPTTFLAYNNSRDAKYTQSLPRKKVDPLAGFPGDFVPYTRM